MAAGEAPVQIAGAERSGIGMFYVAPAEGHNLGAAFLSGFLQTRVPWATALFEQRLAALDTSKRNATLADLQKTRASLLGQLAESERTRLTQSTSAANKEVDWLQEVLKAQSTDKRIQADLRISERTQQTELIKNRTISSSQAQGVVANVQAEITAANQRLTAARALGGEAGSTAEADALDALDAVVQNAQQVANGLPNEQEREAVYQELNQASAGLLTPEAQSVVTRRFQPQAQVAVSPKGGVAPIDINKAGEDAKRVREQLTGTTSGGMVPTPGGGAVGSPAAPQTAPAGGSSSVTTGTSGPTARSDAEIQEGLRVIDGLMAAIESEDPTAGLGGFFDPLPGGRPRQPRGAREPRERMARSGRPARASSEDVVDELLPPDIGEKMGAGLTSTFPKDIGPIPAGARPKVPPAAKKRTAKKGTPAPAEDELPSFLDGDLDGLLFPESADASAAKERADLLAPLLGEIEAAKGGSAPATLGVGAPPAAGATSPAGKMLEAALETLRLERERVRLEQQRTAASMR